MTKNIFFSVDDKIVENNANDMVKEIGEVFDEEEGKVDVENIDLMLDNDNFEERHDLILDSVPENTELKTIISNLNELTQKCKDNYINNMLVSNPNDIDLTNFLKDSVQNNPHESDKKNNLFKEKKENKCQVRDKTWKLCFFLQCKSWKC